LRNQTNEYNQVFEFGGLHAILDVNKEQMLVKFMFLKLGLKHLYKITRGLSGYIGC